MSSYNKMAYEKRYRKVYEEGAEFWEEPIPTEELVEFIEKVFPQERIRVIDLGCGEGRDSIFLAERKFDVTAIDIAYSAIKKAKERAREKRVHINFIVGDVTNLNFIRRGKYELAIDIGCLHMIVDEECREKYLTHILRILKDGGKYFCCNIGGMEDISLKDLMKKMPKPGKLIPRKIRLKGGKEKVIILPVISAWPKSDKQYKEELTQAGFKVLEIYWKKTRALGGCWIIIAQK